MFQARRNEQFSILFDRHVLIPRRQHVLGKNILPRKKLLNMPWFNRSNVGNKIGIKNGCVA